MTNSIKKTTQNSKNQNDTFQKQLCHIKKPLKNTDFFWWGGKENFFLQFNTWSNQQLFINWKTPLNIHHSITVQVSTGQPKTSAQIKMLQEIVTTKRKVLNKLNKTKFNPLLMTY